MRKSKKIYYLFLVLPLLLASCTQDMGEGSEGSDPNTIKKSEIEKLKTFFESRYPGAYVLNLAAGNPAAQTRSASGAFLSRTVTPLWGEAAVTPYNQGRVIEVPVKMPGEIYALKRMVNQGASSHERIRVESRLSIYERADGKVSYRIVTIIPDRAYARSHPEQVKGMSSLVGGTEFTGTVIYSFLNGKMAGGRYYVDGTPKYRLHFDDRTPQTRALGHEHGTACGHNHAHGEACTHGHSAHTRSDSHPEEVVPAEEFHLSLSLIDRKTTPVSYVAYWEDGSYCGLCGASDCDGWCDPIIITPDRCYDCGNFEWQCSCNDNWGCSYCGDPGCWGDCQNEYCDYCGSMWCSGDCIFSCDYCGNRWCSGECQDICSYCGSANCGGSCRPPLPPKEEHQKDGADLTKQAAKTVDRMTRDYGETKAVCNFGVQDAFNAFFNTGELNNKRANDIVQHMRNSSNWEPVDRSSVQDLANEGWFVVAGWENSSGGSGHVCLIVPGEEVNGWPVVMDTGYDMRTDSQPLNQSFGRDKRDNVQYFKYK